MKKILLFMIILSALKGFAQTKSIDNLKQKLSSESDDTIKVWIFRALSQMYMYSFSDAALMYAQNELQLSQQLNFKEGEAWALDDISSAFIPLGNYTSSLKFGYSSLDLFRKINDTFGIIDIYVTFGLCYRDQG